ncbi:MAG: hypothetical protein WA655_23260, partial [Candidatus Korobacteraceae bacterium]
GAAGAVGEDCVACAVAMPGVANAIAKASTDAMIRSTIPVMFLPALHCFIAGRSESLGGLVSRKSRAGIALRLVPSFAITGKQD